MLLLPLLLRCVLPPHSQFMTATEDVADEVKAKLAKMDPAQRDAAVKKAKVGDWGVRE